MFQEADPLVKAAECARAIEATDDPTRLVVLTRLRELWINLADERRSLSESEFTEQIAAIARIHADLIPPATQ